MSVNGHYCPVVYGGSPVIRSLKFESNRRTFGPFGVEEGTPALYFTVDGGKIVGLKGRGRWYLDAIRFHIYHALKESSFGEFRKVLEGLPARFQNIFPRKKLKRLLLRSS